MAMTAGAATNFIVLCYSTDFAFLDDPLFMQSLVAILNVGIHFLYNEILPLSAAALHFIKEIG
jgi:hypothetical protein